MSKRASMAGPALAKSSRRASTRAPVKSNETRWSSRRKVRRWQKEPVILGTMTLQKWTPIDAPVEYIEEENQFDAERSTYDDGYSQNTEHMTSQSSRGSPSNDKPLTRATRSSLGFDSDHLESLPADLTLKGVKSLSKRIQPEQTQQINSSISTQSDNQLVLVSSSVAADGSVSVTIAPYTFEQATQATDEGSSEDMEDDLFDSVPPAGAHVVATAFSIAPTPAHMHDHSHQHHHHDDTDHNPAPPSSSQALHLGALSVTSGVTPTPLRTPASAASNASDNQSMGRSPSSALSTPALASPLLDGDSEMRDGD